jgi:hypothetical protein
MGIIAWIILGLIRAAQRNFMSPNLGGASNRLCSAGPWAEAMPEVPPGFSTFLLAISGWVCLG